MKYATYSQRDGNFRIMGSKQDLFGFSGRGVGRNQTAFEDQKGVGPIPRGIYRIEERPHARFKAPAFFLHPHDQNEMFGRSGFWIHGGTESHGCIILQHAERLTIRANRVGTLCVVS